MRENGIAYTDSLDQTTTQLFEDHGYVIVRGLLDYEEDIRPVRDEYGVKPLTRLPGYGVWPTMRTMADRDGQSTNRRNV